MSETPAKRTILSGIVRDLDLYLSAAAFLFVSCVMFLLVITRYLYSLSLPALEEFTMVVFVWFLYLSMIYCLRYNLHIKVDIPYYVVYIVLPFSFGLFTVFLVMRILGHVKDILPTKVK